MNCINHPDTPAAAFCRTCGKALCPACERPAQGSIFCAEHVPVTPVPPPVGAQPGFQPGYAGASPYTAPAGVPTGVVPDPGASPGLAFVLGLVPGVGAIYNGQYVKGLVHVVILGVLISVVSSDSVHDVAPLFGMLIGVFVFYMAFEAYHTARRRQMGQAVDEFSSIVPLRGRPSRFPVGPVVLIAIGVLFLLNTLELVRFSQLIRYWPVALIALGAYMLYERVSPSGSVAPHGTPVYPEGSHERGQL